MSKKIITTDLVRAIDASANRNYKDTLFRAIFSEKSALLSLYNALNGSDYRNQDELEVKMLDSAIYVSKKNDISFLIDSCLNLYEHQSTINPNMPIRDLIYVAKIYSKMVEGKPLYGEKPIEVPFPQFIILYNGLDEQPERQVLRLSDLYPKAGKEFLRNSYAENKMFSRLELDVLMININKGYSEGLLSNCRELYEYMTYVDRVRGHRRFHDLETSVELAIDECIRDGILEDFLRKNRAEVMSMSILEYTQEEHERAMLEYVKEKTAESMKVGLEKGMEEGKKEGIKEGIKEARISDILVFLKELGDVSPDLEACIREEEDPEVLSRWIKLIAKCDSIEEFKQQKG